MGAHILLASEENFEVCTRRGVYGCVMPSKEWNRAEIVAGILSILPGDLVFFYVKNRGVYGHGSESWKVRLTLFERPKIFYGTSSRNAATFGLKFIQIL